MDALKFDHCYILLCIISGFVLEATERDVVFVLDTSGSLSQSDFYEAVDFVYNVTKQLTIGPSNILVSAVTFSTLVRNEFDLKDHVTESAILAAILNLKRIVPNGGTYTFDALRFLSSHSLTSSAGARSGVQKAVVVLTDGVSASAISTKYQAQKLHNDSVEVYSIGIGNVTLSTSQELADIASDPDSYYLYRVDQYQYLSAIVSDIVPKLDSQSSSSTSSSLSSSLYTQTTTSSTNGSSPYHQQVTQFPETSASSISAALGAGLTILALVGVSTVAGIYLKKYISSKKTPEHDIADPWDDIIKEYKDAPLGQKKPYFHGDIYRVEAVEGIKQADIQVHLATPRPSFSLPLKNFD